MFSSPAGVSVLCPLHSWTTGEEMAKDILQHRYEIIAVNVFSRFEGQVTWSGAEKKAVGRNSGRWMECWWWSTLIGGRIYFGVYRKSALISIENEQELQQIRMHYVL